MAVITVDEVVSGERDVLLVLHEEGHGGWQFYDGQDVSTRRPTVIVRDEILKLDDSLTDVTDLPVGWMARRSAKGQPWVREPLAMDSEG